ncbi:hypothetical protein E2C01_099771 [Portunus trituberculatus]|uniref:Uncharacterized protein n=1 Tax=Portunus trituberculatus TaxID=210409 RepID=A0A5B7K4M9_PORTR|nr:hypothetical protein [Portunus trituberculatus]
MTLTAIEMIAENVSAAVLNIQPARQQQQWT